MVLKRVVFYFALLLSINTVSAQYNKSNLKSPSYRMLSWVGELEWIGTGVKYSKFESGSILKSLSTHNGHTYLSDGDVTVSTINVNAGLHYMHSKRLAFELGTGITRTFFDAADKPYRNNHPDAKNDGYFEFSSFALRTFLGVQFYAPFNKNNYFYVAAGPLAYTTIGASHRVRPDDGSSNFVYSQLTRYNATTGEALQADIVYPKNPFGMYFEMGWMSKKASKFAIYFRYYHVPGEATMYYTNSIGPALQYSDIGHFPLSSLQILFNMRIGRAFIIKSPVSHAQRLQSPPKIRVRSASHSDVTTNKTYGDLLGCIGVDKTISSTLWLYGKHGKYSVERLDTNLRKLSYRELDLLPKDHHKDDLAVVLGTSVENDLIAVTYNFEGRRPKSVKIVANAFRLDGRPLRRPVVLDSLSIQSTADVRLLEMKNGSLCLASLIEDVGNSNSSISLKFFDRNLNVTDTVTYVMNPSAYSSISISFESAHLSIDSAGGVSLSGFYRLPKETRYRGVYVMHLDRASRTLKSIQKDTIAGNVEDCPRTSRRSYISKEFSAVDYGDGHVLISQAIRRSGLAATYYSPLVVNVDNSGTVKYATRIDSRVPVYGNIPSKKRFGYWYDKRADEFKMVFYGNAEHLSFASSDSIIHVTKRKDVRGPVIVNFDSLGDKHYSQVGNKSYRIKWRLQHTYAAKDGSVYFWGKKKKGYVILRSGKAVTGI